MEVVVDRFFLQVVTDATYTFARSVATGRKVSKAQLDFREKKTSDEKKTSSNKLHTDAPAPPALCITMTPINFKLNSKDLTSDGDSKT